jgi:hypothetical protein
VNPAGLGVYRSSEFAFTPTIYANGSSSQYAGTTTTDNNTNFNFSHWGFVFTNAAKGKRYEQRRWKSVAFAFGANRMADFNRNYTYQGVNNTSSSTLAMESDANLNPGDNQVGGTLGYLGYQAYLLDSGTNGKFHSIVPFQGGLNQEKTAQIRGGINEYVISLGGNYMEKWLFGATIGIPVVNYQLNSTYTESLAPGNNSPNPNGFSSFSYSNNVNITGSGVNLKLGAIYKFDDNLRVGLAIHTPTYYNLSDNSTPYLSYYVGGINNVLSVDNGALPGNQFNYSFVSPWRTVLSGTYLFGNKGFITADYEYVNYNTMRYVYPDGYDPYSNVSFLDEQNAINQQIQQTYKGASNIRIGGEYVLGQGWMVRAGLGFYGNPYKSSDSSMTRVDISCGVGYHYRKFFTDLALVHSTYKTTQQPYTIDYTGVVSAAQAAVPEDKTTYQLNTMAWTIGWKFR